MSIPLPMVVVMNLVCPPCLTADDSECGQEACDGGGATKPDKAGQRH